MSIKCLTVTDNTADLKAAMKALTKKAVYVGVPAEKTIRKDEDGKNLVNNAVIGYSMNNGMPEQNVPARPFMGPGIDAVADKIASLFRKAGKNAIEGNLADVERGLNAVGLVAQISIKKTITDVIPPPLAESTLARRRSKGRTGTTPLIDTAQFLNSISYVIRDN